MMKLFSVLAFFSLCLALAVAVPYGHHDNHSTKPPTTKPPTTTKTPSKKPKADIVTMLSDGTGGTASGDQAVSVAANKDAGVAGAKGGDTAFGLAGPGLSIAGGSEAPPSPSAGLFGLF